MTFLNKDDTIYSSIYKLNYIYNTILSIIQILKHLFDDYKWAFNDKYYYKVTNVRFCMKNNLTNKRIEEISVSKVEDLCNNFSRLEAHIEKNDKTPSVDGKIVVRKHPTEKKEDILDYITVQVKGTQVQELSSKEISFDVDIADLNNYLLFDGIIFLVVEIISNTSYRIFYNSLLPYDIHALLKNIKKNQKQKRIKLKRLNQKQFFKICNQFIVERTNQKGVKCVPNADLHNLQDYKFTVAGHPKNIIKYLLHNDIYIKAYQPEIKEAIIAKKTSVLQINEHTAIAVYVDGEKYYNEIVIRHTRTGKIVKIGSGIYISNIGKDMIPKIEIKIQGSIYERIKDIKFLIALNLKKQVVIGDSWIEIASSEKNLKELKIILKELQDIAAMFSYLGVDFDTNLDELSIKDKQTIDALVDSVIYNKCKIAHSSGLQAITVCIANKKIALLIYDDNTVQKVYNYFELYKYIKIIAKCEDGLEYQVPYYMDINAELWLEFCNFKLSAYKEMILQCEPSLIAAERCVTIYLEMLKCYDITANCEYLKICNETIEYLKNTYPNDLSIIINYYQTIKRIRNLTTDEKEYLISIKNNEQNDIIIACVNLILDNYSDYEYYFNRLSEEDKELFSRWPICKFIKNTPISKMPNT